LDIDIKKLSEAVQDQVVKWRRDLHQIPEIGNDLPKTSAYVQNCLKEMGIPFVTMVDGNAVVGTIEGGSPGKTVALRADMDALPLIEEAPVDFKATNGNMHTCGHDAHTAILLGAAKVLNDNKTKLKGTVKLLFQPGEEAPGGAIPMIKEGAIKGVDAVFGQHIGVLAAGVFESGKIIVSHSNVMACRDAFKIKVVGKGAHGAWPENSIDPISIGTQIINGIYMIKAREISALDPAVISIGMVHAGTANNIIPMTLEIEGTTRSINPQTRERIAERLEQVVKNTCEAHGARFEYEYNKDYDITANNPAMADLVIQAAKDLGYGDDILPQTAAVMGSEDMSFFLNEVPGAYYFLSSIAKQDGQVFGHHHPKFMLDESVFSKGVAVFVQVVANYLNK